MIRKLNYLVLFLLSGCISNSQDVYIKSKLDALGNHSLDQDPALIMVLKSAHKYQVMLSYNVGNKTSSGMAVPVAVNKLITAAHVVNDIKVNEYVNVFYMEENDKSIKSYRAVIKNINIENDSAILELINGELPVGSIPQRCAYKSGNLIAGAKFTRINGDLSGLSMFSGVLAYYDKMPVVSNHYNEQASIEGHPPLKMLGQNKIVGILEDNAASGNSGGAIFDVERDLCVVGIVSMVLRVEDLKEPNKMAKQLNIPKYENIRNGRELIVGIPIDEYSW